MTQQPQVSAIVEGINIQDTLRTVGEFQRFCILRAVRKLEIFDYQYLPQIRGIHVGLKEVVVLYDDPEAKRGISLTVEELQMTDEEFEITTIAFKNSLDIAAEC